MDTSLPPTHFAKDSEPDPRPGQAGPPGTAAETAEESLVADTRAGLTPAQMVERKLAALLEAKPLLMSHVTSGSRTFRR
jgi:hypothetical protein